MRRTEKFIFSELVRYTEVVHMGWGRGGERKREREGGREREVLQLRW